ncbi:excinuclease ABC subunit UvrC [Desulfuromonas sp. CSMB_57]|uniref:excinuclease ABC subunit UvrC n=1 Tax=Desulfuromonas sp. CSMB_57 TaxID=2807629 RepID=UPI001CD28EAF|nr:excinuclease ABC subunit UvrC [Desulfuromonas sp. CSMB_57]
MEEVDLKKFPAAPGVYLMKGGQGEVLYVGKAKNLRNRLRSYFSSQGDGRPHIRFLLKRVAAVETIVTDTEKEALILENTLIKQHRPRYNITLRDDKTYLSLRLDPAEEFPTLQLVRKVVRDGARYFGPYSSAAAVRATLKEIFRIFPLRRHPLEACRRRSRPCLYFQLGQCSGPCHGAISPEDYGQMVAGALALLSGRESEVMTLLRQRMAEAAGRLAYEEAARCRDQIRAIEQTIERQKVVEAGAGDQDVVGLFRQGGEVEVALLCVREGKLIDRRSFVLEWRLAEEELLSSFLQQFYGREVFIPDRLLLPLLPEDAPALAEWLTESKGRKVEILAPRRGVRRSLVEMAARNAEESFRERGSRQEAREGVLRDISERLQLHRLPRRMECFDISNVQGRFSVGSMAVLIDGEADKSAYRHYRIRTVSGSDDYAALYEVLRRRLRRGLQEQSLPDFILIDGGKGQLGVLQAVLEELRLADRIDAAGIAKSRVVANVRGKAVERSEERFFLPGRKNPVILPQGSPALFMLQGLRDEAHRFAITRHRKLRRRSTLTSVLEEIPGIGPRRRQALLRHFGSVKQIQAAGLEDLRAMPGLPAELAERIFYALHGSQTSE